MNESWREIELVDCTINGNISYGIVQPGQEDSNGIPIIRVNNFDNGSLDIDSILKVNQSIEAKHSKTRLEKGEVLLTLVGSTGQTAIVPNKLKGWNVARAVAVIRVNPEIGAKWINLWLRSNKASQYLDARANTTVQKTLNLKDVKSIPVSIPPETERKNIEHIIFSIEDKIELNRQMNQTLEAMAQALFKSWFVDFDPVLDNALEAGHEIPEALQAMAEKRQLVPDFKKLLHTNTQLAAQFPSDFEFNEVLDKWVPEGWEVKTLESLSPCNKNSWNNKNAPQQVDYVDLSNTKNGDILETTIYNYEEAPSRAKRILKIGDTIFGTVRPGNRSFAYVGIEGLTGSTGFAVLSPLKNEYRSYTYLFTTQEEMIELFAHLADGAAYPAINSSVIAESLIVYSGDELLSKFEKLAGSNISKMISNKRELETLTQLRDRLLPELISGRVRVPADVIVD